MRIILLAGLALAVTACGGGSDKANTSGANTTTTTTTTNEMSMDQGMGMNQGMGMDQNGAMGTGMTNMGGNMSMDANTQNMMKQDMKTNDPDTNLANGM